MLGTLGAVKAVGFGVNASALFFLQVLTAQNIEIEFDAIFVDGVISKHGDKIGPLWVDDGVVDVIFDDGVVEFMEILGGFGH